MPKRLLILDDELLTAQTIKNIAEFANFEVRLTTSHENFFNILGEWKPNFIALDLIMPGMDGVQVMAELARLGCDCRIIISSGVGNRVLDAARRSAHEHGLNIAGVLPKPFTPASLRALLADTEGTHGNGRTNIQTQIGGDDRTPNLNVRDLEEGLAAQQFRVAYQPKVVCQTGSLAGFEALARWQHPRLGMVPPDLFIPLAEQHDLIDELTRQIFARALRWFSAFCATAVDATPGLRLDLSRLTLSINISAKSLQSNELFDELTELCGVHGIPPQRLIFELTETSAMEDPVGSLDLLTRLRMRGYRLSIDDFGSGYSSMLQLVRLPFSEAKVDKSFVITALDSEESRAVIRSIVDLSHSLGLEASGEGIENEATMAYLRQVGCDLAQGYYIAPPMTGEETLDWLVRREPAREKQRLAALYALRILDTPEEESFDRLTALARRLLKVPIALVTLVDENRQWFKSHAGTVLRETPRDVSFCNHAILGGEELVVEDALQDGRFAANPLVLGEPFIRFYAGVPLHAPDYSKVGTLCVIDRVPRKITSDQLGTLKSLARIAEKELCASQSHDIDELTQLLNQRGFESRAFDVLHMSQHYGIHSTLLFVELDLRRVEEIAADPTHQHDLSDPMTSEIATKEASRKVKACSGVLRDTFRGSDFIARFGYDKFTVLMLGASEAEAEQSIRRLFNNIAGYNILMAEPENRLKIIVGSATSTPDKKEDLQLMLAVADRKMHLNKIAGNKDYSTDE